MTELLKSLAESGIDDAVAFYIWTAAAVIIAERVLIAFLVTAIIIGGIVLIKWLGEEKEPKG